MDIFPTNWGGLQAAPGIESPRVRSRGLWLGHAFVPEFNRKRSICKRVGGGEMSAGRALGTGSHSVADGLYVFGKAPF